MNSANTRRAMSQRRTAGKTAVLTGWILMLFTPSFVERSHAQESPATQPGGEAAAVAGVELPEDYSCMLCHSKDGALYTETTPIADETHLAEDVHWKKGLLCHDCHGGSASLESFKNHREDPDFLSLAKRSDSIAMCGKCHSSIEYMRQFAPSARTDQVSEYWTSGHGQRLRETMEAEGVEEDQGVATCVSCHGKHGMRAVNDPNSPVYPPNVAATCARCHTDAQIMAGRTYNDHPIGLDQYADWKASVHGRALLEKGDLSAPTCNDCHGNHGAMPPGVASVANACGTCHGKISKLFADTQMKHAFERTGLLGCATCHGAHKAMAPTDTMLGMDSGATCTRCHNPDNPQYGATLAGAEVATTLSERLELLKSEIAAAEEDIARAERLGMEVRGPRFDLRQAVDALTNARTLIHTFSPTPVNEALDGGLEVTDSVQAAARAALEEHTHRRLWLAGSLVPILIVVALLIQVIRSMPADVSPSSGDVDGH